MVTFYEFPEDIPQEPYARARPPLHTTHEEELVLHTVTGWQHRTRNLSRGEVAQAGTRTNHQEAGDRARVQ